MPLAIPSFRYLLSYHYKSLDYNTRAFKTAEPKKEEFRSRYAGSGWCESDDAILF